MRTSNRAGPPSGPPVAGGAARHLQCRSLVRLGAGVCAAGAGNSARGRCVGGSGRAPASGACGAAAGVAPARALRQRSGGRTAVPCRAGVSGRGLAHARTYAARHGHLAVPKYGRHEGFALGTWLANQRTGVAALPVDRAQALHRIEPLQRSLE
ncbi:helicase associated domain-containing protein [Streptomyces sp. NPDC059534]|uniref:helicase associated domain-containing protein n=1 Tax=Streptomyces sp. NPDC059534 TaxID=3346859 RepID=UPI0036B02DBB